MPCGDAKIGLYAMRRVCACGERYGPVWCRHGHIVIRSGAPYAKQQVVVSSRKGTPRQRHGVKAGPILISEIKAESKCFTNYLLISHRNKREREREGEGGKAGGVRVLGP